jgi:hypothetical protein
MAEASPEVTVLLPCRVKVPGSQTTGVVSLEATAQLPCLDRALEELKWVGEKLVAIILHLSDAQVPGQPIYLVRTHVVSMPLLCPDPAQGEVICPVEVLAFMARLQAHDQVPEAPTCLEQLLQHQLGVFHPNRLSTTT